MTAPLDNPARDDADTPEAGCRCAGWRLISFGRYGHTRDEFCITCGRLLRRSIFNALHPTRLAVTSLAAQAGDRVGFGNVSDLAHGANHERGPVHEAEYPFHGKENVV